MRVRVRMGMHVGEVEPSGEFVFESREAVAVKGLDGGHVLHEVGRR